ncbi:unnamed protein product [Parajaminaea phylloscopi]
MVAGSRMGMGIRVPIARQSTLPALVSARRFAIAAGAPRQAQVERTAPIIQTPLPSIESTVARLLPPTADGTGLPVARSIAESVIGQIIEANRATAAQAETVEAAAQRWQEVDERVRQEWSPHATASELTDLSNLLITSSNDPRRHSVAFHLYRVAFGTDPALLPETPPSSQSSSATAKSEWGDWQAAYQWASLVMQGKAPPRGGTSSLGILDQRNAQRSQHAAAYNVFSHLAAQGHPHGIFGLAQQLLSTLDRSVDPTALGAVALPQGSPARSRKEIITEVERLYRQAAEAGVEQAWFQLGALYMEGKWVRKDMAKARSFLEEAVEQGSPRACHALAHLLTKDVHTPVVPTSLSLDGADVVSEEPNPESKLARSLQLLERGATLGSDECAFAAGMRYLLQPPTPTQGDADTKPSTDAQKPYDLSLDPSARPSSDDPAQLLEQARREHYTKWGVEADDVKAAEWLTRAAEGGNTLAMMNLARMFLEGRVAAPAPEDAHTAAPAASPRMAQLLQSSRWYSRILAKAMGPEGQKAKALSELQQKLQSRAKATGKAGPQTVSEPGLGLGSGRLDDLGVRAEEGLRVVQEEIVRLSRGPE